MFVPLICCDKGSKSSLLMAVGGWMKCVLNKVQVQLPASAGVLRGWLPVQVKVCSAQVGLRAMGTLKCRAAGSWHLCPWGVCLLAADRAGLGRTTLHTAQVLWSSHLPTSVHPLLLLVVQSGAEWTLSLTQQSGSYAHEVALDDLDIALPHL